jgi:hypothetical protein
MLTRQHELADHGHARPASQTVEPQGLSLVSAANEDGTGCSEAALKEMSGRAMNSENHPAIELDQHELELQFQRLVVRRTYANSIDPTKIVDGLPRRRQAATVLAPSYKDAA